MSLDVAPDGKTIVFDLLGDLYTIPIDGGRAVRLTGGMAFNQQPRYSPDGRQLVFVSDRGGSSNLWITDRNGQHATQLSELRGGWDAAVSSPAWSPDGQKIVVSQIRSVTRPDQATSVDQMWLLAVYDVATRQMRWISDTTPDGAALALGPTYSPDGRTLLAAVDQSRASSGSIAPPFWRIVSIDLEMRRTRSEMWRNVGRVGMRPAVSRDGRYIAYVSSSGSHPGLRLRDLRANREWWLVREVLDDPPIFPQADPRDLQPGYAFTPDSKAVIVAYSGHIHRIEIANGHASIIPFVADVERPMGPLTTHQFALPDSAVRTRGVMQPALSPDGTMVAFSALDRLWAMELPHDGRAAGRPYRLTADSMGEFYPSWSPDGTWLAYSTWRDGEGGAVRRALVTRGGSGQPTLSERLSADTAIYFHTIVAPDGERVVAVRAALTTDRTLSASWDAIEPALVWLPSHGGRPHAIGSLTTVQSYLRFPVDQVYFTADPAKIYVGTMAWTWSGRPPQAAFVVGSEADPEVADVGAVLAPDGQRALVSYRRTLFEVRRPALGHSSAGETDTLRFERLPRTDAGKSRGPAHRWGTALQPWISWSRDGRRVLFNQGGTLFLGSVDGDSWTTFERIDVPLTVPLDVPRGAIALRGARVVTMRSDEVIERADLVVLGNRIAAIGPQGTVAIPHGARVLDVTGRTILPGYVDLHDHLRLPKGIHPQQCWQCLTDLAFGVTTARDPQPSTANDLFTYRERERTGELLGPRIFATGSGYFGTEPAVQTLEDAREAVHPNAEYFGSETFKVAGDPLGDRRVRQLLVTALAEARLNGTVHTDAISFEVATALDGLSGLEHAPGTSRIYDDVARLIAQTGAIHTQTYGLMGGFDLLYRRFGQPWRWPKWRRLAPPSVVETECHLACTSPGWYGRPEPDHILEMTRGAARIIAHGGQVGIGSHGDLPGLGYHYELWLHALGGMLNHEILQAATIVGATAIGHAKDLGSLEVGKLADLQVLTKNPLEDIHHTVSVQYVMKNGRLYEADDLTEIWPSHRRLDPLYLWE